MNVKLLRKVAKHILAEPKRLLMRTWILERSKPGMKIRYGGDAGRARPFAKCGTAACISGWACILTNHKRHAMEEDSWMDVGKTVLGISYEEAHRLFGPDKWPTQFAAGTKDDGKAKTAKIAAARIEHFIKTKGKE